MTQDSKFKAHAKDMLLQWIKEEQIIYTSDKRIGGTNGLRKHVKVYTIVDGELFTITSSVAALLGSRYNEKSHTISTTDYGRYVVFALARELFGNSQALQHRQLQ